MAKAEPVAGVLFNLSVLISHCTLRMSKQGWVQGLDFNQIGVWTGDVCVDFLRLSWDTQQHLPNRGARTGGVLRALICDRLMSLLFPAGPPPLPYLPSPIGARGPPDAAGNATKMDYDVADKRGAAFAMRDLSVAIANASNELPGEADQVPDYDIPVAGRFTGSDLNAVTAQANAFANNNNAREKAIDAAEFIEEKDHESSSEETTSE